MSDASFRTLCWSLAAAAAASILAATALAFCGHDAPVWFGAVAVASITTLAALARPPRAPNGNGSSPESSNVPTATNHPFAGPTQPQADKPKQ